MAIYGTSLLSVCLLVGMIGGKLLGMAMGIDANVGGVGMAMLLLIVISGRLQTAGRMLPPSKNGVLFWSAIYIPVVVAMSASQNVLAAVNGGAVAIFAGVVVVIISFAMVPLVNRIGRTEVVGALVETDDASKGFDA